MCVSECVVDSSVEARTFQGNAGANCTQVLVMDLAMLQLCMMPAAAAAAAALVV